MKSEKIIVEKLFQDTRQTVLDLIEHYETTGDILGLEKLLVAIKTLKTNSNVLIRVNRDSDGSYWMPQEDLQQIAPNLEPDSSILMSLSVPKLKKATNGKNSTDKQG